jgi:Phage major capsid protein E
MNPTPGDVHVNATLTNISIAYMQSQQNFVAARIFPNIPVAKQSDLYWQMDRGDFNRDEMKERAPSTESEGGGYRLSTEPYFAPVYAFHHDIDDQTRANADSQIALDRNATELVTMKGLLKREKLFVTKFFGTGLWGYQRNGVASGETGTQFRQWSDAGSDPIADIRRAKREMMENTGMEPNKLVLGRLVYDALIDHPDIIDRINRGQTSGPAVVNKQALAALFEVETIEVMNAIENIAKEGQPNVHRFIGGKHAMFVYAPATPGQMTASAGYTFSWTGLLGSGAEGGRIRTFRQENIKSDRVEIEMAFVQKVIGSDLGYFFADAVS